MDQQIEIAMCFKTCIYFVFGCLFFSSTFATDVVNTSSEKFLKRVAGVYKDHFQNGDVDGDKFNSENILEVVPVDKNAAYVRMHLEFYNGAMEDFYGIAAFDGYSSLIYDNGEDGKDHCVVEFTWSKDFVTTTFDISKTPGCTYYTIPRGSIDGARFEMKRKKVIRYIQRIKNSKEFKKAMELYQEP